MIARAASPTGTEMENLKKNIHFAVFGGGVLLGIIFVAVGFVMRGGTEDQLTEAKAALQQQVGVPTKGTYDDMKSRADRFEGSLQNAEQVFKGGVAGLFDANYQTHNSGSAFYSNEGNAARQRLMKRWEALEKPQALPALLKGWKIERNASDSKQMWDRIEREIGNPPPDRIRDLQRQLRILEEVVTICERLVAEGADMGMGVKLIDFKADNYQPMTQNRVESPWMVMQWDMRLECAPGFAILLYEELVNPSARTMRKIENTPDRLGFVNFPLLLQMEVVERPTELRLDISNADKGELIRILNENGANLPVPDDPSKLDPEKPEGKKVIEEAEKFLAEKQPLVYPVRAGLRLQAAGFNKDWRAIAEQADQ
jgi:hypothetical protein